MKQPNWAQFDPQTYLKDNYIQLHEEDKKIIKLLTKFYQKIPQLKLICEVGAGPNLYPIMATLPRADRIEVVEYSLRNIIYLMKQKKCIDAFWNSYSDLFQRESNLYNIDIHWELKQKLIIKQGSIYKLPKEKYDLSSMHFCAESITENKKKFTDACMKFISSVKQGGYLVASFMENSKNYHVGNILFPSYPVNKQILKQVFESYTTNLVIYRVPKAIKALRPGYTGMLLLTAQRK